MRGRAMRVADRLLVYGMSEAESMAIDPSRSPRYARAAVIYSSTHGARNLVIALTYRNLRYIAVTRESWAK